MAQSYLLGRNAKAYFNSDEALLPVPLSATPATDVETWLDLANTGKASNLVDVSLNISSEYADGTTRETAASGFASSIPVLRGGEVTFEARWKPTDPAASALTFTEVLLNAWENDGVLTVVFLDQAYHLADQPTGTSFITQGLAANFNVSLSKTESLRDVQRMSVSLTIADSATWYTSGTRVGTG